MICEVLFKIGDDGRLSDGMPIEVRRSGVYLSSAEFIAWGNGNEPASIAALDKDTREHLRTFVKLSKTLGSSDFKPDAFVKAGVDMAELERTRVDMKNRVAAIHQAGGTDTTWALEELKVFGVMIADLTRAQMEEVVAQTIDVAARKFVIPYKSLLSTTTVGLLGDRKLKVVPARTAKPFTFTELTCP